MRFTSKLLLIVVFGLVVGFLYSWSATKNATVVPKNSASPINVIEQFYGENSAKKSVVIVKIDQTNTAARIDYNPINPPFLAGWLQENSKLVINGSYFNADNSPSGYLVVDKKRIGEHLFDQDKSGLVAIANGKIAIRDLAKEPLAANEKFDFAMQSYPFLIKDFAPALARDTGHKARRSAIGSDEQNNIYAIIADESDLSLYEFMNVLLQTKIKFKYVLNLDGGPSSGMMVPGAKPEITINSLSPIPFVISVK